MVLQKAKAAIQSESAQPPTGCQWLDHVDADGKCVSTVEHMEDLVSWLCMQAFQAFVIRRRQFPCRSKRKECIMTCIQDRCLHLITHELEANVWMHTRTPALLVLRRRLP